MKHKIFCTVLFLSLCIFTQAQSIKRGFKSLEKKEYAKAKDAFKKTLSSASGNVGANFGMAIILADEESPYFDIIDSWGYIEKIEGKTAELSQEDIEIISEYFMNTEVRRSSRPVKKKMNLAVEAIEQRLIKYIREENDLDAVYEVLGKYPNFRHYDNVIHIRNQFEYRKYEKRNTLEAYDEFIAKFPDAAQVEKASNQRYKIAFDKTKSQNTVAAYTKYINTFPESKYIQSAIRLRNAAAYTETKRINTLVAYENFIASYPESLEVSDARIKVRELLYDKAKRIKSLQAYNDFINKYPDGGYFIDIFNLKAAELGAQFIKENNFDNPALTWVKAFDNNGRIEEGGAVTSTRQGGYVLACNTRDTDSSYADAWVIKLDASGKMIWNKTVGQMFEDSVKSVMEDSQGNIIVLGYTHVSADSASKMGWMFKLASDGTKRWNKNLGKINIQSSAIDGEDKIYIGGGISQDSLGNKYALTIFNSKAQKISERVYTGRGSINDIEILSDGNLILAGSNWLSVMDSRRYMKWDNILPPDLNATHCAYSGSAGFYFAGANKEKIFYSRYNPGGKEVWLQDYGKTDSTQIIKDAEAIHQGNFLVMEQKSDGAKIKSISNSGSVISVKEIANNIETNAVKSMANQTVIILNNKDLIILKYSNLSSL